MPHVSAAVSDGGENTRRAGQRYEMPRKILDVGKHAICAEIGPSKEVAIMGPLDEKVTLVTGGSTGIGLAIAQRFADEGATVYITGRRKAELDAAVKTVGERAIGVQSDVSHLKDLDRLLSTVEELSGRLDVVVANAGVAELARLGDITEEQFDKIFGVDVKGTLFTVQKALPLLPDGPR
jgi:NAD(P)-dependent dehydrogenase (short-subunit alcohol dehydrogenase family)